MRYGILKSARRNDAVRSGTLSVHTGLSRTVAKHLISVERDNLTATAVVKVAALAVGVDLCGVHRAAVEVAAVQLRDQAQRVLGLRWIVKPWDGEVAACVNGHAAG